MWVLLSFRRILGLTHAFTVDLRLRTISFRSVLHAASLWSSAVPAMEKHCVLVSCIKEMWCRKLAALRWPLSDPRAPFSFVTGRRRAFGAGFPH